MTTKSSASKTRSTYRSLCALRCNCFTVVRSAGTAAHLNTAFRGLKNVHVVKGDVADYWTMEAAASQVSALYGGTWLNCLIHNAAGLDEDFIDAKIVVISMAGADPKTVLSYGIADMAAYQITKAAALMATTKYAIKLKDDRFVVVWLTPGLVDVSDTFGEHDPGGVCS
ncbi:hypothetical protein C8Q80DRAFT_1122670 [Daedaleopsis nitida]|nr:hypothetical protein C8Q80DRAFT_1122670 [Daedaleopsis nitida]